MAMPSDLNRVISVGRAAAGRLAQQQLAKLGHDVIVADGAFGLGDDELAGFVQGGLAAIHVEPGLRNRGQYRTRASSG